MKELIAATASLGLILSLGESQQSTLVVFKRGPEVARSTGDTNDASLGALLRQGTSRSLER